MKLVVLFCVILAVKFSWTEKVEEIEEVFREEYCNTPKNSTKDECSSYRCNKDNSKIIGIGCAEARCSGNPIGFKGDRTRPYPDCCIVPICEDN